MKAQLPPDGLFDFNAYLESLANEPIHVEKEADGAAPEQEFHHSTCKNSRCTTCDKARGCEMYIDLADLSINGFKLCMAECESYEPYKFRKLPKPRTGPDNSSPNKTP